MKAFFLIVWSLGNDTVRRIYSTDIEIANICSFNKMLTLVNQVIKKN